MEHTGSPRGAIYAERKNFGHAATGALVMFRDVLDKLMPEQWTWQPYRAILPQLPNYCVAGVAVWRTRLPLIFGSTVEWHRADRVLRQFGVRQPIPHPPVPACTLEHAMGKEYATQAQLQEMDALWNNIEAATVPGDVVPYGDAPADPLYMQWYRRVSILCIGLPSSTARMRGEVAAWANDTYFNVSFFKIFFHFIHFSCLNYSYI